MDNDTTSSAPGATPNVDPPVTGTNASSGATPPKAALSLEEALKRIEDLEHSHKNATEERDRHRKKLSAYEEAEKKAQEAQLSEIERVNKQYSELKATHDAYTQQMQERIVSYEVQAQAAKLGIIDPDVAVRLLDWSDLEFDEHGTPTNAVKLLEKLLKNKPYLAPAQQPTTPAQSASPGRPAMPTLPAMNPGRNSITAPNTSPPGKPIRLSTPGVFVPPGTPSKYQP